MSKDKENKTMKKVLAVIERRIQEAKEDKEYAQYDMQYNRALGAQMELENLQKELEELSEKES